MQDKSKDREAHRGNFENINYAQRVTLVLILGYLQAYGKRCSSEGILKAPR